MIGGLLLVLGIAAGITGWLLLRRYGDGWRIGRLLSAAPRRTLVDAGDLARAESTEYVRLHGRIDSDEEFPADDGKPIVFRRRRLQHYSGRTWQTFDDERLAVPFSLSERGERVGIDGSALGDGLVVVPRVSDGVAADLTDDAGTEPPPELPPETPVRLRLEQVSAVDHGTAAGVPRVDTDGNVVLGPGLGRPLILTTLDLDEAMRVLGSEARKPLLVAAAMLVAAPILAGVGIVVLVLTR